MTMKLGLLNNFRTGFWSHSYLTYFNKGDSFSFKNKVIIASYSFYSFENLWKKAE